MSSAPHLETAPVRPEASSQADPAFKKGTLLDLTIESLAYGGKGVAREEGFVIFVERAMPGQTVRARITKRRRNHAEARVEEILEPGPHRVEPKCAHFGVCGGCLMQNYPYEQQLAQKQAQVEDLFARLGGFGDIPVQPIIPCPEQYHYRNKMEFTFSTRPWRVEKPDRGAGASQPGKVLGLHVPGRFDKVLDIHECWLQPDVGNRILQLVKERAWELGLEPYNVLTQRGFLRHLVIRTAGQGSDTPEVMVNLVTSREDPQSLKPLSDSLVAACPEVTSVVNNINTRKADVAYGEREILLYGKSTITEQLCGLTFDISANSFFQTNTQSAEVLYGAIEELCALSGDQVLYDLYCGTGTIALTLAAKAREAIGFELGATAVDDAARNALANSVTNARFMQADLTARYFTVNRDRLAKQIPPPDIVVIDPPRPGLHPNLVKELLTLAPRRIVYVSCNPATQVRDAGLLRDGGYRLVHIQPLDMHPQTPHIENLCLLERTGAGTGILHQ